MFFAGQTASGPGSGPGTIVVRQVNLPANDLVYNPYDGLIYASVPSRAGPGLGNTLTAIEPYSGELYAAVFMGSEPGKLAISDTGQYIYAALDGAAAVQRFDTTTYEADLRFPLTRPPDGPRWVEDLAVQPGNPEVLAVTRYNPGFSPRHAGTVIYVNGQALPNLVREGNVIEFSDSPDRMYGYNNELSSFGFSRMNVDENGVVIQDVIGSLITGFAVNMVYEAGLMYTTTGRVIDPEARVIAGTYSASGLIRPDAAANYTYILSGNTLTVFDLTTFVPLRSYSIPGASGARGLIRWGETGLAFTTPDNNRVFLVEFTGSGPGGPIDPLTPQMVAPTPVGGPPPASGPRDITVRQIALRTRDLIYDPSSGAIWASVPSTAGARGNTLTWMDPWGGEIGDSIFVGSEPNKLAISDDTQYLYVGLDGTGAVRRFDLINIVPDIQFALSAPPEPPRFVDNLAVVPGNPQSVAIATQRPGSPRHAGLFRYDDGLRLPNVGSEGNTIAFADSPDRLYGYNNEITSFGFSRWTVDANGISRVDVLGELISGFGLSIKYAGGLIYTQHGTDPFYRPGRTVHPEDRLIEGTYWGLPNGALVVPDVDYGLTYYLFGNTLRVYDMATFVPIAQYTLPGVSGQPTSLLRWGENGLAFRTSGDQVFLVNLD